MKLLRFICVLLVPVIAVLCLQGCTTNQAGQVTPAIDVNTAKLIVSYATLKVIDQADTAEEQHVRAKKISDIATQAKSLLSGDAVTLGMLELAVRDQIKPLNLSPADAYLADALVTTVIQQLTAKVGVGVLSKDELYQVTTVLGWVIDAAAMG